MNDSTFDDLEDIKNVSLRDVHYAISELQILLKDLPKTAEYTLNKLDEIKTGIPYVLEDEIDYIIGRIEAIETHKSVERESDYESDLYDLRIRLETYIKLSSFQDTWERLEKMFSHIDQVWPPSSFDFRTVQNDLDAVFLPNEVMENIDKAVKSFNDGRFHDVFSDCGHAATAIIDRFCSLLKLECEGHNFFNQIDKIKKHLDDGFRPQKAGLEWYVIFLVSVSYWLRNAEAHKEESVKRIPPWMDDYRKKQINRVETARVALVCTLQAAKELQKWIEMDRCSESTA